MASRVSQSEVKSLPHGGGDAAGTVKSGHPVDQPAVCSLRKPYPWSGGAFVSRSLQQCVDRGGPILARADKVHSPEPGASGNNGAPGGLQVVELTPSGRGESVNG